MAPFRKIGETLGARINWDQDTKIVTAHKGEQTVVLQIGNNIAYIDKTQVELDTPPIIMNNRTLVPIRFFSEAFGATVMWENEDRTVLINTDEKPTKYIMGYYYSQSYSDFLEIPTICHPLQLNGILLDANRI